MPFARIDETRQYSDTYRLDLGTKRWCVNACQAQLDIADVAATVIVLQKENVDTPRQHDEVTNRISRQTGEHTKLFDYGIGQLHTQVSAHGQCEKSEFTGFPKVETKF